MGTVSILVPLVTSLVTYTFVSMGTDALVVDDTGALIIMLAFIKVSYAQIIMIKFYFCDNTNLKHCEKST